MGSSNGSIAMQGMMMKKKSKSGLFGTKWVMRYFVLYEDGKLVYFQEKPEGGVNSSSGQKREVLCDNIGECALDVVNASDLAGLGADAVANSFYITGKGRSKGTEQRTLLVTNGTVDFKRWILAFRKMKVEMLHGVGSGVKDKEKRNDSITQTKEGDEEIVPVQISFNNSDAADAVTNGQEQDIEENNEPPKPTGGGGEPRRSNHSFAVANTAFGSALADHKVEASKKEKRETTIIDNNEPPKPMGGGQPRRSKLSIAVANAAEKLEASKKERRETAALAAMLAADATPPPEPEEGPNSDVCSAEDDSFPVAVAENPPSNILQNGQEQEQDIEEGVSNIVKITITKQSPDDKLGFVYDREPSTGRYFITSVAAGGLCGQAGLQTGQEMLEINGISLRGMEREEVRDLFAPSFGRVTDVTMTVTKDIKAADAVPTSTNTTPDIDIIRSNDANLNVVNMISSLDGVRISRAMPSIFAYHIHMPATYWINFCDELDELLVPVADAKKLLIWLDVYHGALFVLSVICGALFGLIDILFVFAAWAVIFIPAYNCIVYKVKADLQKISNGMKVKISRVTTQYPAIVLKVTPFDEEVGRRIKRVRIFYYDTNRVFSNLDYIEVSINQFGRRHAIENAVATRTARDNPSAYVEVEEEMFHTEITEANMPWWKRRLAKILLICCVSVSVLAIGLGVGLGVAFSRQPPASTSTVVAVALTATAAPSMSLSPSQAPSLSPSSLPSLSPSSSPSTHYKYFATRNELKAAVDTYVSSGCNEGANVCPDITSKYGWPMNSWSVGDVTDMSGLFDGMRSFNADISSWDVSQVQNMDRMFYFASSFNGDLSLWNVSRVRDMHWMFYGATSFKGDLSSWNVSQVRDTRSMFYRASSFKGDVSLWDVSQVRSMRSMFSYASSFNGNISSWNVSQVRDMERMFADASSFNVDVSLWDVSQVWNMDSMFWGASSFNGDISLWNVSQVQDMRSMFAGASSFNGDLSLWNVSQVQDMRGMFADASSFNGDLSLWDVSQVQNMRSMFNEASSFNGVISLWDVSQVQNMYGMFNGASSFNVDVSLWDISQVQDMMNMFNGASSFNQNLCAWADKNFPYNRAQSIFDGSGCTYKSTPQVDQGGPFCASDCN